MPSQVSSPLQAQLSIEPIGVPATVAGDPVQNLLAVPRRYEVTRTDAFGVSILHDVPQGTEAFVLCVALDAGMAILSDADGDELHRQLDVALGFGDAAPKEDRASAQTNQQRLAWRVESLGFSRDGRLAMASRLLNRTVESFSKLTDGECVRVWERACDLMDVAEVSA